MSAAAYWLQLSLVIGALLFTWSKDLSAIASAAPESTSNVSDAEKAFHNGDRFQDSELQLQKCVNSSDLPRPTSQQDFLEGKSSRLLIHQTWHSRKQPPLAEPTIFTALTASRLDQLKSQCQNWPGPLSAALYVAVDVCDSPSPSPTGDRRLLQLKQLDLCQKQARDTDKLVARSLAEAAKSAAALQAEMDQQPGSCALDLMLLYELILDHSLAGLLPINQLRNYAALQARTDLVAMVDVDLVPSKTLSQHLMKHDNLEQLQDICSKKTAVVIPAFQTAPQINNQSAGHELAAVAVKVNSKQELKKLVEQQLVFQFHMAHYRQGHDCTNYHLWLNSYQYYSVKDCWTSGYEPWYIVNRRLHPHYDQLFRGYGWNKVSHVIQTYHAGFDFQVIKDGFLIHREHETSSASKEFYDVITATRPESLKATNTRFRKRVIDQMKRRRYKPVTDAGFQACLHQLPWWKDEQPAVPTSPTTAVTMMAN